MEIRARELAVGFIVFFDHPVYFFDAEIVVRPQGDACNPNVAFYRQS